MQLIWMAHPTAKVVTISITARTVLIALAVIAAFFVLLGGVFNLIGLRVAVEHVPELAQRMGGVTSQSEQQKMESIYRSKLDSLNQQLNSVADRLSEMEALKNQALERLGLQKLQSFLGKTSHEASAGRGGPLNFLPGWGISGKRLDHQIDFSLQKMLQYDKTMTAMHQRWQDDLVLLDPLPTMLPLTGDFAITSSFGVRIDPFTHLPSLHDGIDFVAPVGTPVLATAAGTVLRAEFSGAYGNMVEVAHAQGFVTRYAHLQRLLVKPHDVLQRHDAIGTLGNTGRSSGPHLHYEVIFNGQAMHPTKALAAWAKS